MKVRHFALLLLLGLIWGSSFFLIKLGVSEMPAVWVATGRMSVAAVFLLIVLRLRGLSLLRGWPVWKWLFVLGLLNNTLPFTLIPWGEERIASGLASILNATTPLFTVILAHFLTTEDRLNRQKLLGIVVGFIGVIALVGADLRDLTRASTQGELAVIVSSACYALAIIIVRLRLRQFDFVAVSASQFLAALLLILPVVLVTPPPTSLPSLQAIGAVTLLGLLGSGVAYLIYYGLLQHLKATQVSLVTYLVPITAVFWGAALLDETLSPTTFLGLGLILLGILTVNGISPRSLLQINTLYQRAVRSRRTRLTDG